MNDKPMPHSQRRTLSRLALAGLMVCLACTSPSGPGKARVRIGQFLWTTGQATVTWYHHDQEVASTTLAYGELSEYQSLAARTYLVKIKADDRLVLEKEIGLGTDGLYTVMLTGIPEDNQPVNKQSTGNRLHHLVEGAVARTANDYLPQLIVQNDFFVPEPQRGSVRWVSLLPGTVPLDISLRDDDREVTSVGGLAYPRSSDPQTAKPGEYELAIHLDQRSAPVDETPVHLEDGALHTYYLVPSERHYLTAPRVVEGVTRKPD